MKTKLTDVAKLAGVSPTTVSRVINHYPAVSKETIQLVQKAMKELNYQPNAFARGLHGKNTNLVGIILPNLKDSLYADLVIELEKQLHTLGYLTTLCISQNNKEKEQDFINQMLNNNAAGLITASHALSVKSYHNLGFAVTAFDRKMQQIPYVHTNNYESGFQAAKHLIMNQRSNLAMFDGLKLHKEPVEQRAIGFREALAQHNIEPLIFHINMQSTQSAKQIEKILLSNTLDGIFCSDEATAVQLIKVCKKLAIQIPKQLQICSYTSNENLLSYLHDITIFQHQTVDIAKKLIEILMSQITKQPFSSSEIGYQAELVRQA